MYAKCNCFRLGYQVFTKTSKKRTELAREAVELFKFMLLDAVKPNDATLKSVLPPFVIEADPRQALSMHSYLVRSGFLQELRFSAKFV